MQVDGTQLVYSRRRNRFRRHPSAAAAAAAAPGRALDPATSRTWRTVPLGPISKAAGPWEVDWERAHADARRVIESIDFSKRDIVIWVPGTSNSGVHSHFEEAVRDSYRDGSASLTALSYEATWHLRRSVPTGIATLKLVLEEIARRGGNHRVMLSGESQGAWIIGEAIADPAYGKVVTRALLMGHPWLAAHQYARGEDPRVQVVNHVGDQVTMPVKGNPTVGLDAMIAIRTLQLAKAGSVLQALASNPSHGVLMLKSILYAIPGLKTILRNPHVYAPDMTRAVEFLRTGRLDPSEDDLRRAGLVLAPPAGIPEADLRLRRQAAVAAYSSLRAA